MLGAARREHRKVPLGETFGRILVDRVQRIHEAIAEGVSIHVKRRVDEMRNVRPEHLVAGL